MKKTNKKLFCIVSVVIAILLAAMAISSYQESWGQISNKASDISLDMQRYANQFYGSKYHIWHSSFQNFGLLLFLLVPIPLSEIYGKYYYEKTDRNIIYRKGLRRYYFSKIGKALFVSAILSAVPLLLEWLFLSVLPTTGNINIEGVTKVQYAAVPSVTILDPAAKKMAVQSPDQYVVYSIAVFAICGMIYCFYAFAIANFMRSRILRYLAPVLSLVVADFIVSRLIPNFTASILFDTFNPAFPVGLSYLIVFYVCLFIVTILLLTVHFIQRSKEG